MTFEENFVSYCQPNTVAMSDIPAQNNMLRMSKDNGHTQYAFDS